MHVRVYHMHILEFDHPMFDVLWQGVYISEVIETERTVLGTSLQIGFFLTLVKVVKTLKKNNLFTLM